LNANLSESGVRLKFNHKLAPPENGVGVGVESLEPETHSWSEPQLNSSWV